MSFSIPYETGKTAPVPKIRFRPKNPHSPRHHLGDSLVDGVATKLFFFQDRLVDNVATKRSFCFRILSDGVADKIALQRPFDPWPMVQE